MLDMKCFLPAGKYLVNLREQEIQNNLYVIFYINLLKNTKKIYTKYTKSDIIERYH